MSIYCRSIGYVTFYLQIFKIQSPGQKQYCFSCSRVHSNGDKSVFVYLAVKISSDLIQTRLPDKLNFIQQNLNFTGRLRQYFCSIGLVNLSVNGSPTLSSFIQRKWRDFNTVYIQIRMKLVFAMDIARDFKILTYVV